MFRGGGGGEAGSGGPQEVRVFRIQTSSVVLVVAWRMRSHTGRIRFSPLLQGSGDLSSMFPEGL